MTISDNARAISGIPGRIKPVRPLPHVVPRRNREDWLDALYRLSPPPLPADVATASAPPSPITPAMEAEADADIAAGRVTRHDDMESLFTALDVAAASAPPEQPEPAP